MIFWFQPGGIYSWIELYLSLQWHVWFNTSDLLFSRFRQYIFQNNSAFHLELDKQKCRFKNNKK